MKLEIELLNAVHEETLSTEFFLDSTLELVERVLKAAHWHSDEEENVAKRAYNELHAIKPALINLQRSWMRAAAQQAVDAAKKEEENPLWIMWYWDVAEKLTVGEPFAICKKHMHKVHIPAGKSIQRASAVPTGSDLSCKFCEFDSISQAAKSSKGVK